MNKFFAFLLPVLVLLSFSFTAFADAYAVGEDTGGYLPPDEFFDLYGPDDYDISVMAVQSSPNTPVTSASGLKGILLNLFGSYDPPVTQLRYQANSNSNYTYVNDIQPDYPWLCSAAIFAIVLFCVFRLGGALLCRV